MGYFGLPCNMVPGLKGDGPERRGRRDQKSRAVSCPLEAAQPRGQPGLLTTRTRQSAPRSGSFLPKGFSLWLPQTRCESCHLRTRVEPSAVLPCLCCAVLGAVSQPSWNPASIAASPEGTWQLHFPPSSCQMAFVDHSCLVCWVRSPAEPNLLAPSGWGAVRSAPACRP